MDIWSALAGIGAVAAAGVAVWAVIVAHNANRLARDAAPPKLPIIEGRSVGGASWQFTNVGNAPLYDAVLVEMYDGREFGNSGSPKSLHPGDQIDIDAYLDPHLRMIYIRGHEIRDGIKVARWFQVL